MNILVSSLTVLLAGAIGFAAHRANLCTVRAVQEILSNRRAHILMSFLKTSLWVVGVTYLVSWGLQFDLAATKNLNFSSQSILGGLLFGAGATINRGCAFSTLTRLGSGNLGMVTSLLGFLIGSSAYGLTTVAGLTNPAIVRISSMPNKEWAVPISMALAGWMTWELVKLLSSPDSKINWRQRLLAPHYRLSTAAMIMGFSNAIIYLMIGAWSYTLLFGQTTRHVVLGMSTPPNILWVLFLALIGGIGLSAWQSHRFRWQWQPQWRWVSYCTGGVLMGFGAGAIPGGNDALIMNGLPSLSPHAAPTFLAMLAGIAVTLMVMRRLGQNIPPIDCSSDLCLREPGT